MQNVRINADGELYCPSCGARQFSNRRTRAAKLAAGATVGIGALAAPKRLQCLGCREYLKGPPIPDPEPEPDGPPSVPHRRPAGPAMEQGDVPVVVTDCEWTGPSMLAMLAAAAPALDEARRLEVQQQLRRREPAEVARLTHGAAPALVQRLIANGFSVRPLQEPPAAAPAPVDIVEQLTRLAALRDQGILTEEEFLQQKAKLLGDA